MALKLDPRCKVCKLIRGGDEELLKRIQTSKAYVHGGEPLAAIHRDYEGRFLYNSLFRHVKKHQGLDAIDLVDRRSKHIQRSIQAQQIKEAVKHTDVRDYMLEKGLEGLKDGKIKLTAASLVSAAKQQSDIEEKHLDRQMKVMEMIHAFASGEYRRIDESSDIRVDSGRTSGGYLEGAD